MLLYQPHYLDLKQEFHSVLLVPTDRVLDNKAMFSGHLCPPSTFSSYPIYHAESWNEFFSDYFSPFIFKDIKYMLNWSVTFSSGKPE